MDLCFLGVRQFFQLYNAYVLYKISKLPIAKDEWQVNDGMVGGIGDVF
jgi:hypothetical protein